ncbi:globin [Sulfuricurvum sp.]|uniref:globin domain-containing protein n=1 Tax=Sulfuricurvum sp. TaxID=2025608 RepID=UPI003563F9AD
MNLIISDGTLGQVYSTITKPNPEFFQQVGEERFRKLVNDHYELIRQTPISFMFPIDYKEDFDKVKKHAADFLIQMCGGPDYYAQTRGDPRMLARHARFRIDEKGRKVWLECYATLLQEIEREGISKENIQSFWNYLDTFSKVLVNTENYL